MGIDRSVRIMILGDTSFGEPYQDRLASQGREPVLRTRGYDYMIRPFAALLSEADFRIANLETPVTDRFPSPFAGIKQYLHYADVEKTPLHLAKHRVDLVSLANNHAFDFGIAGLRQTIELLHARGIEVCGAGPDSIAAGKPYVKRFDIADQHIHIALLCMFEYDSGYDQRYQCYAGPERGGINALSTDQVASSIAALRQRYSNLLVIAYPHWGENYRWVTDGQRAQGHAMIDAGVDLVVGHGAHMLQEFERYGERWIGYGLGNFVFGTPGRYDKRRAPPYGALAMLVLSPGARRIHEALRIYPIFVDNRVTNYQSRFVTDAEFRDVRRLILERSGMDEQSEGLVSSGRDEHGLFLEFSGICASDSDPP